MWRCIKALCFVTLRAKLNSAVYCNRSCPWVCLCVCVCGVCYHDNSKLCASIFTKLGLYVKVVTNSSWLNFGRPVPLGRGLRRGGNFWLCLTTASAQCLRLSERFFHYNCTAYYGSNSKCHCHGGVTVFVGSVQYVLCLYFPRFLSVCFTVFN